MSKKGSIDERCRTTHTITALSVSSAVTVGTIMLFAIPLNSVIIYCLVKDRKKKYKSLFYKLLLNIAIADLLTGLIPCPTAMNFLINEIQGKKFTIYVAYITQISVFFTDSVALLTLTILSLERIAALVYTIKHHKGVTKRAELILLLIVWPLGMVLVLPFFYFNFIRQLLVYSSVVIGITIISLVVTVIIYRKKLGTKTKRTHNRYKENRVNSVDKPQSSNREAIYKEDSILEIAEQSKQKDKMSSSQQKATGAFIIMLCVFLFTYLPTTVSILYMNICTECNCDIVHVLADYSFMFILSSSVFRPLNFILTLKHLKLSVARIFKKETTELKTQIDVSKSSSTSV